MKILISIIMIMSDHKIKIKINEAFIEAFNETHKIFNNKSHVTFSHFLNEITINQNLVFSSANMIITKKTIFVLNAVFQIIQLKIVNSLLISIEYL